MDALRQMDFIGDALLGFGHRALEVPTGHREPHRHVALQVSPINE